MISKRSVMMLAQVFLFAGAASAQGPAFDSSGNGLLNGTHYFRQVVYFLGDNNGDLGGARVLYGNISFDGGGHYSIAGATILDSGVGALRQFSQSGTYSLAASGYGFLSSLLPGGNPLYVAVANDVVIGSTTEGVNLQDKLNDMFVSAKVSSPLASASTFQGSWAMAGFIPDSSPGNSADVFFSINPDAQGNLGTVTVNGFFGDSGNTVYSQVSPNVKYTINNGAAVIAYPNLSNSYFFPGQEYLYFSPDGKFVFGGSPGFYDMVVGVKNDAAGTVENFQGMYYQAGIDQDTSQLLSANFSNLDTYYGMFSVGGGSLLGTQRVQSLFSNNAVTSTFSDTYPATIMGSTSYADPYTQYAVSNGGAIRIGAGIAPFMGVTVGIKAPVFSGPGVFLNPAGVVNAASSAGFMAGVSNGELLTLYGSGLAPDTFVSPGVPFLTTLGGVQVLINGVAAPIYYVSATQVSAIVPYGNTFPIAQIQVINNGTPSNMVTEFVNKTNAGMFTVPPGGLGFGALVHNNDGTLVTTDKPAQPGEYIQAYVTGLGSVFPPVADGAAGPADTLSSSIYFNIDPMQNMITVYVGGVSAPVVYAGLAPYLAGLYQVNFQVPATGLTAGNNTLGVGGPDSFAAQTVIPVGSGAAASGSAVISTKAAGPRRVLPSRNTAPSVFRPRSGSLTRINPAL